MAKQSLLQITLLQIVKICILFCFFNLLTTPFYLKCIPLFQGQANRKHTSAALFFKHFSFYRYFFIFSSLPLLQILSPLACEDRMPQQLAFLAVSFPMLPPQLKKASIGMLGLCEFKVLCSRFQVGLLLVWQVACLCYLMGSERIFPHSIGDFNFLISTTRLQQPSPIFLPLFFYILYACLFACLLIIAGKN